MSNAVEAAAFIPRSTLYDAQKCLELTGSVLSRKAGRKSKLSDDDIQFIEDTIIMRDQNNNGMALEEAITLAFDLGEL